MTLAVEFAGGGAKGQASNGWYAAQWPNRDQTPPLLGGESIGAVQAYGIATVGAGAMGGLWDRITPDMVYKGSGGALDRLLTVVGIRDGIYDMSPALETILKETAGRRIRPGTRVVVTFYDLEHQAFRDAVLTTDTSPRSCAEIVLRSCLVPLAHAIPDGRYVDGGVGGTAPVGPLVRQGATDIRVCLLHPAGPNHWPPSTGPMALAARTVECIREEGHFLDLERTALRNRLARLEPSGLWREVAVEHVEPAESLGDWMDFSEPAKRLRRAARFQVVGRSAEETWTELKRRRALALAASLAH